MDPQATLTMLWRNSLSITGQTHEKLSSICFLQWQKSWKNNCFHGTVACNSLSDLKNRSWKHGQYRINYKFHVSVRLLTIKLASGRARISAVIVKIIIYRQVARSYVARNQSHVAEIHGRVARYWWSCRPKFPAKFRTKILKNANALKT